MPSDVRHIVLLGPMGVGKTTVGTLLADEIGRRFVDSDACIAHQLGRTGARVAATEGVERLHRIELEVFIAMASDREPAVLAPGASIVDTRRGRCVCADQWCVVLSADDGILVARRRSGDHRRTIREREAHALTRARSAHHRDIGHLLIDTSDRDPAAIVREIIAARA